jgi:hypothetical protein
MESVAMVIRALQEISVWVMYKWLHGESSSVQSGSGRSRRRRHGIFVEEGFDHGGLPSNATSTASRRGAPAHSRWSCTGRLVIKTFH